ncbi:lipopolysaccharide kinase InaA family protein [Stutzerimonas zhaodongensis]|jgi:tRNA A-37 threonylcarbamoyl transferase component Bud32|uniref:lipopolysaccharide kinase InaA family protein n=1 Tax=Stutzerimonas zhaodongensis TaxID=1176257 RepID=UPI001F4E161F|nr:lipopolysaccharide kinase InaA family protein [Stutzerimonas zhaodongensis]UNG18202.1 serine/threonine protein kinase [Stutzerimonas zhaodongensis]
MKLAQLRSAGRTPSLPMIVALGADELHVMQWLRVLPGQRYVARAQWRGVQVLAKLMVGDRARRHFDRELAGAQQLAAQQLNTPALLDQGFGEAGGWLLFEYLEGAQSLHDAWLGVACEVPLSANQQEVLGCALAEVANLHAKGLWQSDLHLDNLMRHKQRLYLIDGGGIRAETPGQPLSRERVLENLAVFFAQLPTVLEPFVEELLVSYLLVNSAHALPLEALLDKTRVARHQRLASYLKKVGRDCTAFSVRHDQVGLVAVRREREAGLRDVLKDPDGYIAAGAALKQGGSATVARVDVQEGPLVIKRYNIKGVVHWLKRFWRPSRAWHSWVEAHRLEVLGIATPQPLAMIEVRRLGLRGRSYLITDYVEGQDIIARFAPYVDSAPPEHELLALEQLFAALIRERISHGDLKGTNVLWRDGSWALIDLDSLQQHRSPARFHQAFAKDRERLLCNWPAGSTLYRLLDLRLPKGS